MRAFALSVLALKHLDPTRSGGRLAAKPVKPWPGMADLAVRLEHARRLAVCTPLRGQRLEAGLGLALTSRYLNAWLRTALLQRLRLFRLADGLGTKPRPDPRLGAMYLLSLRL